MVMGCKANRPNAESGSTSSDSLHQVAVCFVIALRLKNEAIRLVLFASRPEFSRCLWLTISAYSRKFMALATANCGLNIGRLWKFAM